MTDYINQLFLELACITPLPAGTTSYTPNAVSPLSRPPTHPQPCTVESERPAFEGQQKKRNRKPEVTIFIDTDTANAPAHLAPTFSASKKTRLTPRLPLAVKSDFGNGSPRPSRRAPEAPWPSSSADPLWENRENYFLYTIPVAAPRNSSPAQPSNSRPTPRPASRPTTHSVPRPTTHSVPRPAPQPVPRPARRRRASAANAPRAPNNMVLYNLLELQDWNAGTEQIQVAYRRAAMKYHPDRVPADQQHEATVQMQRVNAAKEVLLDARRRRAYNRSGKLPWDT
jgi:hypothetical protein